MIISNVEPSPEKTVVKAVFLDVEAACLAFIQNVINLKYLRDI